MKRHGSAHEILPPYLPTLNKDAVVRMLLASMAAPESRLWSPQSEAAALHRDCVPLGKNCTPSSSGYNSHNDLGDRLGQEDIVSSFADSVLRQSVSDVERDAITMRVSLTACD